MTPLKTNKTIPCLWFDNQAEEAINFYAVIFDHSNIKQIARYGAGQEPDEEGTVMYANFELEGYLFAAMDSAQNHDFSFSEAISLVVSYETQEEIDYYWSTLSADSKAEQCGWLKDKFGVSWQIVPRMLPEMMRDENEEKARRVTEVMMKMKSWILRLSRKRMGSKFLTVESCRKYFLV